MYKNFASKMLKFPKIQLYRSELAGHHFFAKNGKILMILNRQKRKSSNFRTIKLYLNEMMLGLYLLLSVISP